MEHQEALSDVITALQQIIRDERDLGMALGEFVAALAPKIDILNKLAGPNAVNVCASIKGAEYLLLKIAERAERGELVERG